MFVLWSGAKNSGIFRNCSRAGFVSHLPAAENCSCSRQALDIYSTCMTIRSYSWERCMWVRYWYPVPNTVPVRYRLHRYKSSMTRIYIGTYGTVFVWTHQYACICSALDLDPDPVGPYYADLDSDPHPEPSDQDPWWNMSVADRGCLSRTRVFSIPDPNPKYFNPKMVSKLSEI